MGGLNRIFAVVAWPFLLAGVGAFGLGGWTLWEEFRTTRMLQEVAAAPQPQAVPIETFDPAADIHALGEVHVTGQLDLSMQYDLLAPGDAGGEHLGVMIPIYAQTATDTGSPALGVLLYDQGQGGDTIGDVEVNSLVAQIDGEGAVGPYISLGGQVTRAGRYHPLVLDAFAENGRTIAEDFLAVAPFRAGRAQDLAQGLDVEKPMLFGMGGTIAVLLAMIGFSRGRAVRRKAGQPVNAVAQEVAGDTLDKPEFGFEQETGLIVIPAYSPEMADGSAGTSLMREVLALGRRSDETTVYSARREGIDEFAALDSGGLKRPLAGRGVSEKVAGPKPVKKESPLAAMQDPSQAADIMAAVQAEIAGPVKGLAKDGDMGDIFAAVQAAVRT
ncbi:hypothetical protein [Vannielia litorea]|uniref:Uncharacterized protein n=1 Tax=Vannielia litorea TaxID=1217970 RepID=A0A1N6E9R8_9RHOB|nr:hypothetical protein [Vannielia litorea]SIN79778.1 hypothetical protein SAMN05444002_0494 [Vannielia litorea]